MQINVSNSSQYLSELISIIPNIKTSICLSLFGNKKFKEPIDALIFGVLIGYFSTKKEIQLNNERIENMVTNYFIVAKKFRDDLELLLQELVKTNSIYFTNESQNIKDEKENVDNENSMNNGIDNIYENIFNINNYNIPNNNGYNDDQKGYDIENDDLNINNNKKENFDEYYDAEPQQLIDKCKICLDDFNILDPINYTLNCNCIIHYPCFDQHVASVVESNQLPVKCPFCNKEVNAAIIFDSLTQTHPELLDKYDKFTLNLFVMNNAKDTSCCPTAGCDYIFFLYQGDHQFQCPKCNKDYCLNCKTDWHDNITCENYQHYHNEEALDRDFYKFVAGQNFKKCIKCAMWVEKNEGCNHMTCRCGAEFCYKCGVEYSPNHQCKIEPVID